MKKRETYNPGSDHVPVASLTRAPRRADHLEYRQSTIVKASINGHMDVVRMIIERGADMAAQSIFREMAIWYGKLDSGPGPKGAMPSSRRRLSVCGQPDLGPT
jgi:hypothetical protein